MHFRQRHPQQASFPANYSSPQCLKPMRDGANPQTPRQLGRPQRVMVRFNLRTVRFNLRTVRLNLRTAPRFPMAHPAPCRRVDNRVIQ